MHLVVGRVALRSQAVEKVGVEPVNDLESSSKRPKIGVLGVRSRVRNGREALKYWLKKSHPQWLGMLPRIRKTYPTDLSEAEWAYL